MRQQTCILALVVMLAACEANAVGTLAVGNPTVEDGRVVLPIILGGDVGGGVAAMDFRLSYDPQALRPVAVDPGVAASQAGKQVMANAPRPGEYNVVVMGMNQSTCTQGEVAMVVMERMTDGGQEDWGLDIANLTMASADGTVIDSEPLPFEAQDDPDSEDDTSEDDASEDDTSDEDDPEDEASDTEPETDEDGQNQIALSAADPALDAGTTGAPEKTESSPKGDEETGNFDGAKGIKEDDSLYQAAENADRVRQDIMTPSRYSAKEDGQSQKRLRQARDSVDNAGFVAEGNGNNQGNASVDDTARTLVADNKVEYSTIARGQAATGPRGEGFSLKTFGSWNRLGMLTVIVGLGMALLAAIKRFV